MSRGYRDWFPVDSRSSAHAAGRPDFFTSPPTGFPGADFQSMSRDQRIALLRSILERKVHGLAFSPYLDGQSPGLEMSEQQIRDRLAVIQPYTRWIRTFSCTEGNQASPRIAHELGLKTMVGIDLGPDSEENEHELANGLEVARKGHADILAVGNEVLLRGDLTEDQIIDYMQRARDAAPGVPVSYVDAYFLFENHPRVADACDLLLVNCYPFWESCPAEHALVYMKEMYRRATIAARGKPVVISETGWPTTGSAFGGAQPSYQNAMEYFIRSYQWAAQDDVEIFYFSSFDESWKVGDEGDVGAYWGLWDKDGNLKYA